MIKCSGCGATNPPGRAHCVRCGTLLKAGAPDGAEAPAPAPRAPDEAGEAGAPESEDSGFKSLGSIELKKAGHGLAGLLGLRGKAKAKSAGDDEPSGEPGPADEAPQAAAPDTGSESLLEGFQSSLLDQLPSTQASEPAPSDLEPLELDLPSSKAKSAWASAKRALPSLPTPPPMPAPGASPQPAREPPQAPARAPARAPATPVRTEAEPLIIGAPPLQAPLPIPEIVRAIPAGPNGMVGTMIYGVKAPRVAQRQRDVVNSASAQLGKLKKKEHELVLALGHAARVHDLVPDDLENGDGGGGRISGASAPPARAELDDVGELDGARTSGEMSTDEQRLIELGHQHENLAVQLGIAQRALVDGEDRVDRMRQREAELRSPPREDMPDAEIAQRVKEYETVKGQRVKGERELEVLQEKVTQAKAPLRRLKDEIEQLRSAIQSTNKRRMETEARKKGQRPSLAEVAEASSSPAARDEELGRQLLVGGHDASLRQLVVSTEICRRRIAKWEGVLREQQSELERYDEPQARKGFFMFIGSIMGVFVALLGAGEIVRRILLAME